MSERISPRACCYLAVAALAAVTTLAALPLALRARADSHMARGLTRDELVLVDSAAEARRLTIQLHLDVAHAALHPGDGAPADRFRADHARLIDALRQVHLHAAGTNAGDIANDLENSAQRYAAGADTVFAAAAAGSTDAARVGAEVLEPGGAEMEQLAERLTGTANGAAHDRAEQLSGGSRTTGFLLLALVGLIVAVHAGALAAAEAGPLLAETVSRSAPAAVRRLLARDRVRRDAGGSSPRQAPEAREWEDERLFRRLMPAAGTPPRHWADPAVAAEKPRDEPPTVGIRATDGTRRHGDVA